MKYTPQFYDDASRLERARTRAREIDGTAYPIAPGVVAGAYTKDEYRFVNFRYMDIFAHLVDFLDLLRSINPSARVLLTVSPVPLAATASAEHVLVATTRSKSVLRAVASDLSEDHNNVAYFPSYELINGHSSRYCLFNSDLRTISEYGVQYVMQHFSKAIIPGITKETVIDDGFICDENLLVRN